MIALLVAAALSGPTVNCRPRDLWRRQAGQACLTPGPIIAPAHVEAVRRQLKSLMESRGQADPKLAAELQTARTKAMAAGGIRRRSGPPADPAPFHSFAVRPGPKVSPYSD